MSKTNSDEINVIMLGPDRGVHGGISAVVNNYYKAGLDDKVKLTYIPTMKEGSKFKKLLVAAAAYFKFLRLLNDADIIHVNVASDNSFVRKSLFIKKAYMHSKKNENKGKKIHKIVIHQHGGEWKDYYASLSEKAKKNTADILKMGDEFLVLSPYYKDFFEKTIGIKNVKVFPDTIKILPKRERKEFNEKILFLGRLCKGKGVAELIEASAALKETHPDLELYLGGIWEDTKLSEMITPHDFIHYIGWINEEEKVKWFKECSIFALPSYFEGQSVAILEAMNNCLSVVATNVGGIPMMISNRDNGILVEPQNANALADGIRILLDNKEECRRLSDNAYETVKNNFNIDNTVDEILNMYEGLIDVR